MNKETFELIDTEVAHAAARRLYVEVSTWLRSILPPTAEVQHIGATAVPGCITKGDLDIVVRVYEEDFEAADRLLAERFTRNEGSVRTNCFSAFEDSVSEPHLGIQLTVINSPYDFFHLFVDALLQAPEIVEEYNTLKRSYNGSDMTQYRIAKDEFIEKVLSKRQVCN